jgi:hypothetical protein
MSELCADFVWVDGKRALRLRYAHIARDPRHNDVLLVEQTATSSDERFPAAYQFTHETRDRPYSILRIVVPPGVSVRHNFPDVYMPMIDQLPLMFIYRVQDAAALPPMGVDIVERQMLAPFALNDPGVSLFGAPLPPTPTYFQVVPRPNGVTIRHPLSEKEMRVTVPPDERAAGGSSDGLERFAYDFYAPPVLPRNEVPFARVVATSGVDVKFAAIPRPVGPNPMLISPLALIDVFRVYKVPTFGGVPMQGTPLEPEERFRITSFERVYTQEETLSMAGFDIAVGFVPVLGDIVDIAELVYGVVTGSDRWGRPLSTTDLMVMGVGALLPFVGAPLLRRGKQLVQSFGRQADLADDALAALKGVHFDGRDAEKIVEQTALVTRGLPVDIDVARGVLDKIAKVEPKPLALDDLLNGGQSGFTHAELQEFYLDYVRRNQQSASSPRNWALNVTKGRSREVLERVLGADYVKLAGGRGSVRPKNLIDIPRPEGFTDELVDGALERLADDPKLFERLGNLIDELTRGDDAARAIARTRINSGHFRILKGNIAEIFSRSKQIAALEKIAAQETLADAVLISGVRMRLPKAPAVQVRIDLLKTTVAKKTPPALLFSDNIIAVIRGDKLQVLVVFEVKSGFQGGAEATEQVFKWIERNVEAGAELVLEKGAQLTSAGGKVVALDSTLSFTYKPGKQGVPEVLGLQNAQRTLITAAGVSHLGVDSSLQIAKPVIREVLDEFSSAHLDYLVGQVVQRFR